MGLRIGSKFLKFAKRVGQKIQSITAPALRIGGKIAAVGKRVAGAAENVIGKAAPLVNMATGGRYTKQIKKALDTSKTIGRTANKLEKMTNQAGDVIRKGTNILDNPATLVSNARAIQKDIGGLRMTAGGAYKEARDLNRRLRM